MDLAELKFVVKTEDLDLAAKKIDALAVSVSKLNKPMQAMSTESAKANKELSKAEEAAAKAALAQARLEQAQNKSTQAASKSTSVLERQNLILEYMAQGNSKGQASILATAKAAGALDADMLALNKTLVTQRTLIGGDPFDKSIGLMQKLQNEYKITNEVTTLFNKNLGLTQKQMTDLAREKERLIALYAIEGKDIKSLTAEYDQLIQKSKEINTANDARNNGMKSQIKAQADAAKANAYLADVDARLAAALDVTNKSLDKQSTDALVKYQKALKTAGLSADEAATKLAAAKTQFEAIADKKQADKLQYLARAISVQMGDVGISLASGMNPLLVMIQQGDQIRGAIQQAGAEGKDLERAMAGAATQIATSFIQTGQAIGGFFVNAVKSAAKSLYELPLEITRFALSNLNSTADVSAEAIDKLKVAFIAFGKTGILFIIVLLATLATEYIKVTQAEKELTKSLAISGAALGMSTTTAIEYATAMNEAGISTLDAMRMIGEFANTGTDARIPLEEIIKSAKDMQKYVGIASADTMKAFADIAEKPVEGLIKLAKTTGNVTVSTILQAEAFVKAGEDAEAARIAQQALSDSNQEVTRRMKNNLDPLQTLWIDIKSSISKAGEAVYNLLKSATVVAIFRTAWETVSVIVSEVWYVLKETGYEISGIFSQIKAVMSGDFSGAKKIGDQMQVDAKARREEQDALIASIMNRNKAEKETLTITEDQRKLNRKAAKEIEERLKNQKAATFTIPEDTRLKDIQNKHKIAMDSINAESNKMISANKVEYALGLKDIGDYMTEEIQLIVDFNNKRVDENNSYIEKLNTAEASQLEAIKKAIGIAKSHAKSKEDVMALDKQLIDTVNNVKEAYNRLRDSVKATNEQLADKSAEAQMKAIENLGQYTKKVMEGSKEFTRTLDDNAAKRKLQIELENQLSGLAGGELARVKAQIDAEQSHISKLSELEKAALQAGVAMSKLTLSGLDPNDPKYKNAAAAVKNANDALEEAKGKSRQEIVQAGIDAEMLYYTQEYNKLKDNISDALVTALIEGGETGGKKLRSILEAELRKPITVFVKAVVDILGSGINSAIGGKAGSTLGSTLGGAVGNLFSGSALGATLFGNSAAYGAAIGTTSVGAGSQAAMLAAQTGEFGAAGLSATAGSGGFGASMAAAGPYVLAALAVANALGVFRSTKQVGGGISGVLGASTPTSEVAMSGFLGKGRTRTVSNDIQQYALMREGGSLIDGPNYYRQNQGTFAGNEALQQTFNQLKTSTKMMADTLKLSSAGIEDFTKVIDISFDGLTDAQRQEKIASTFASVNDELAALVLGAGATAEQLSTLYNNVMQQRYDLETQLLELQGKTLELRERERAKIYDANKEMFDQIKALEDQKSANEAAAVAMEKLTSVTTTIVDEINRLRGVSQTSSGLESQFAILTAQARSGDLTALAQLPEVTKGLEQIAASSAVNATDIIFARARLAQSLQDTLGYFPAGTLSTATTSVATLPSVATASAGASVSAASSNQELLAALVIEVQGLRAEVRADVSHNAKTAKILERVNQDGESLTVTTLV